MVAGNTADEGGDEGGEGKEGDFSFVQESVGWISGVKDSYN